jgi:IS605 OrfB family transposase
VTFGSHIRPCFFFYSGFFINSARRLHKASRSIIQLAQKYDVSTIVVGDMTGIKQENHSKTFVQVPIQKLPNLISYKAKLDGRKLVYQEESYTSGVSAIDLEPITKESYNKSRPFSRGLFRTNGGLILWIRWWVVHVHIKSLLTLYTPPVALHEYCPLH